MSQSSGKYGWILFLGTLMLASCKMKDADTLAGSSPSAEALAASRKYELCKASEAAWSGLLDSIAAMEKAGKSSLQVARVKAEVEPVLPSVLQLLDHPPQTEPPACGESYDQALSRSYLQVSVALSADTSGGVLALDGGREFENSTGILSITRLPSGHYRIELLGLGGRQRSEMIMSPKQLKGLAGTLLRGV